MIAITIFFVIFFTAYSIYCSRRFTASFDGWVGGIAVKILIGVSLVFTGFCVGHYFGWN
jgi:hypothetical protein